MICLLLYLNTKIRKKFGNDQAQMTDASLLILFTADLMAWQKDTRRYWQNAPEEVCDLLVNWMGPFHEGREWLQRDEAQRSFWPCSYITDENEFGW